MNNRKALWRVLSLSLAFLMVVTALVSCNNKTKDSGTNDGELEEGGLEGFTLNVLSKEHYYSDTPGTLMYTEEANGDTIREAVYSRNSKVQKDFGLEVTQTYIDKDASIIDEIVKLTAAQDDAYQVCTNNYNELTPYISQNLFTNTLDLPYIDLDADYWQGDVMDLLSLNGYLPALFGDIIFDTYEGMLITMYNTPLANDYGMENLYDVTNEGSWTYDRMETEMEKVITDLDNDGRYTFSDRIGLLYASNNCTPYFTSAGITFVSKDSAGEYYFDESVNEKATEIGDKVGKMLHTKGYACDWLQNPDTNMIIGMIENKQVLFQNMVISQVRRFYREIKTDFGLLPMPKLNEDQEKYYGDAGGAVIIVPTSNLNLDKTGFALEALARYSADFPNVYFHVCLESKFTRDAESIDMIMLCYRNIIIDPLYEYDFGGFASALNVVIASNRSYTNVYANMEDAIEEDILEFSTIEIG